MKTRKKLSRRSSGPGNGYGRLLKEVSGYFEQARSASARSVNAFMTATYWMVGRRIVEFEQSGQERASYGKALLVRLAVDLSERFGRGFSDRNLLQMRLFYRNWPIPQTLSAELGGRQKLQTPAAIFLGQSSLGPIADRFPLPWSHYVRLLSVENPLARKFYETEALRGGWSVRQLERQINSQFYERTALSRNKADMLLKGGKVQAGDTVMAEDAIKDPLVLEFLGLKDEYSESDLEEALVHDLEGFLLELGGDFAFVGRQRRLRVGAEWYRVDLLFYHRDLRCLVVIDLKLGKFTHADAGQMHLYLNYAREHWTKPGENPPVGLILCSQRDHSVAHYALEGLPNKVLAAEYRTMLPKEGELADHIHKIQARLGLAVKRGR